MELQYGIEEVLEFARITHSIFILVCLRRNF
jgi:hypothetical protein